MLLPALCSTTDLDLFAEEETRRGRRVLLFAFSPNLVPLQASGEKPVLPSSLLPLGMVSLRDELRHDVQKTLADFAEVGVQIKTLAGQVGIPGTEQMVAGHELESMDEGQLVQVAEDTTIFGRITPQQKERLVQALRHHHHYVAMIGDGSMICFS